jgi:hypothetical protein
VGTFRADFEWIHFQQFFASIGVHRSRGCVPETLMTPIQCRSMMIVYETPQKIKKANPVNGFAFIQKRYHKYFRPLIFTFS